MPAKVTRVLLAALLCVAASVAGAQSRSTAPPWQIETGYEMRWFRNIDDILANSPGIATRNVDASTNGFDVWVTRYQPGFHGLGVSAGGYVATGIETDITRLNGHRSTSNITDSGLGFGAQFTPAETKHFSPFASLRLIYEWNRNNYTEFNLSNDVTVSESRTHGTWTGEYGIGGTYWVQPRFGFNVAGSYSGRLRSTNADENFKLSTGFVLRLGSR